MKRAIDWNQGLAERLKNDDYVRQFILASQEEGIDLKQVLLKVIKLYGVVEFSKKAKMPSSNLLRALTPKSNPTLKTINSILEPFNLKLSLTEQNKIAKRR